MDNYDTPDNLARKMAALATGKCLEPAAGVGAIAKHLPPDSVCIEIDPHRYNLGVQNAPQCSWRNLDFLDTTHKPFFEGFDTVVTNPPFSKLVEFIEAGLNWVKPKGQLIYLMPLSWMGALGRGRRWQALDGHISQVYMVEGRIDYLYEGLPMSKQTNESGKRNSGRREYDAVFIIRPGSPPLSPFTYL